MTYLNQRTAGSVPARQTAPQVADLRAPDIAMSDIKGAQVGGVMIVPQSLAEIVDFGKLMASAGTMVRPHLRNNHGACVGIAMQAFRWGMDPFAVASKSFLVNDQISYEAQLLAAVVIKNAPITGRPEYRYSGEGERRRCTVSVTLDGGRTVSYESPEIGRITPRNSPLWKSDPDQQLGYYSVRAMARRHFPDVLMGVYDIEEADGMRDVTPAAEPAPAAPAARRMTDALDRLQKRRSAPRGDHVIEADQSDEQPAPTPEQMPDAPEGEVASNVDPETGEIAEADAGDAIALPQMPDEILAKWESEKKWGAAWKWLQAQAGTAEREVLAHLLLSHDDILDTVAAYSADAAAAVATIKQKAGL